MKKGLLFDRDWEKVSPGIRRLRVEDGWLVESYRSDIGLALTFVPDLTNAWQLATEGVSFSS